MVTDNEVADAVTLLSAVAGEDYHYTPGVCLVQDNNGEPLFDCDTNDELYRLVCRCCLANLNIKTSYLRDTCILTGAKDLRQRTEWLTDSIFAALNEGNYEFCSPYWERYRRLEREVEKAAGG